MLNIFANKEQILIIDFYILMKLYIEMPWSMTKTQAIINKLPNRLRCPEHSNINHRPPRISVRAINA